MNFPQLESCRFEAWIQRIDLLLGRYNLVGSVPYRAAKTGSCPRVGGFDALQGHICPAHNPHWQSQQTSTIQTAL